MIDTLLQTALAYLIGTVMGGQIVGALRGGIDLRKLGSGNLGATNALRTQGAGFALAVLAIDVLKGVCATWLVPQAPTLGTPLLSPDEQAYVCGVAVAVGHCYPVTAGFRGGKGVATLAGVFGVLLTASLPWLLGSFVAVVVLSGYVSLATIMSTLVAVLYVTCFSVSGLFSAAGAFTVAMALLVIWKHRENVRRLLAGNEHRFEKAMVWRRWHKP
ncbi:glycerol-3-phosphate 1-O-acyltransferase PlsY [Sinimarinibacterium sp. CAU 1509]|uniref:glycerol-3-phosphate 1-O-acyltransferase PlsY n=1 Tax=Sinimarinibacterium sp. CAU 1509 TaxID=2562283 RepID=UPI0010AB87AB|nr:glycerol-3-phosphate 1-O-acyltransferase PlsY [Sinimarinibacterium sp. CAU 1509]TJY63191.1 glycerol-3-phosphate 1-O-acyltransferase PlsY [Sinimarinibacterium sp. CAU 1509]